MVKPALLPEGQRLGSLPAYTAGTPRHVNSDHPDLWDTAEERDKEEPPLVLMAHGNYIYNSSHEVLFFTIKFGSHKP